MYLCGIIHEVIFVMTKKLLMLCAVVLAGLSIYAQEVLIDVVHLKNGSTIKGFVTEQIPDKGVKVQTPEGSLMFFDMKDVVKIVKEAAPLPQSVVMSLPNPYQHGFVRKSPFTAGLLSCIIPGLGQLYATNWEKGWGPFIWTVAGLPLAYTGSLLATLINGEGGLMFVGVMHIGVTLYSVLDAVYLAQKVNMQNGYISMQIGKKTSLGFRPEFQYGSIMQQNGAMTSGFTSGIGLSLNF